MKYQWNYQDCIDLEYLIEQDREIPDTTLHQRDRDIFLQLDNTRSDAHLKKAWLERRRQLLTEGFLPGKAAGEAYSLVRIIILAVALISGFSGGLAYFHYSGEAPVNVFSFFTIFILFQLLLILISVISQVVDRKSVPAIRSILLSCFSSLVMKMFNMGMKTTTSHLTAEQTAAVQRLFGRRKRYDTLYRKFLVSSFFVLLQAGGVLFNLGLFLALLTKVGISDIAFGWQSTLQFSAESLYTAVKLISLPWSWLFGEGSGFPTLAEIEGSRIVLKEGIAHLATENLISWWPFLLLSVAVYGLGLRALLLAAGYQMLRRTERHFIPKNAATEGIVRRMRTPVISSQTLQKDAQKSSYQNTVKDKRSFQQDALRTAVILMPDDCCHYSDEELHRVVEQQGFTVEKTHTFQISYADDLKLLKNLEQDTSTVQSVILFAESWMPPVKDTLSFIGELRRILPEETLIIIWLLGKPGEKTIFTPVTDADHIQAWTWKIEQLGDPYLDVIVQQTPR